VASVLPSIGPASNLAAAAAQIRLISTHTILVRTSPIPGTSQNVATSTPTTAPKRIRRIQGGDGAALEFFHVARE